MANKEKIDPLTSSAADIQQLLEDREVTSSELVIQYLDQIEKHNHNGMKLHAVISVAPKNLLLQRAEELDRERQEKGSRGPMHGIPILVKDTFSTSPSLGLETTCGTWAMEQTAGNAEAIESVLSAGMIVLGKANLDELAGNKGYSCIVGWSARGGQTQSPYVRGGVLENATFLGHSTPGGSSSGSGAGVAAGFAPISLGTETDGSIVQPASRAALYALKPTFGSTSSRGIMPVAPSFDTVGGMAKTVKDLADITGVISGGKDFSTYLRKSWTGLTAGFVDPNIWQPAPIAVEPREDFLKQSLAEMNDALKSVESLGARVERNIPLVTLDELQNLGDKVEIEDLFDYEFKVAFEEFLATYTRTSVRTVQELVDFNTEHASLELPPSCPTQETLLGVLKDNMTKEQFEKRYHLMRDTARKNIETVLSDNKIEIILAPGDARMASVAALAGYPHGAVPLGFAEFNGRAFGLNVLARAGEEDKIFAFMSAWEATFPQARQAPPMLVNWDEYKPSASL